MTPPVRPPYLPIAPAPPFTEADVRAYVERGDVPEPFLDIITYDIMRAPVQVQHTRQIYDRQSLAQWRDTCLKKKEAALVDPNTNICLGAKVQLTRVPQLEKELRDFRAAVNRALARRGEPPLEEPAPVKDGLPRDGLFASFARCLGF